MRYPTCEKFEIIRLVEESALPVRWTLEKIGIPRVTFYRWYDLCQAGGSEALDDRYPRLDRVWNRIPDDVRARIIKVALDESAVSPRELAVRFTDTEGYFVSEASVYRLLKAHDLIASPAFIVKAADEFKDKTTAPNELLQTNFTYLKVIGWVGSTCPRSSTTSHATSSPVHHNEGRGRHRYARMALDAAELHKAGVPPSAKAAVRQRLLIDLRRPGQMAGRPRHGPCPRGSISPDDPEQDRALASDAEKPHPILRTRPDNPAAERKDHQPNEPEPLLICIIQSGRGFARFISPT